MDFEKFREPFAPSELSWRIAQGGVKNGKPWAKVLAYLDNRAIMDRLDAVAGPANWRNEFATGPGGGVICGISLHVGGEWITKWDGAENTDIEEVKGGLSDAMKRAAVQWGIGRYLYDLKDNWAEFVDDGRNARYSGKVCKDNNTFFHWNPPRLPSWAQPAGAAETTEEPKPRAKRSAAPKPTPTPPPPQSEFDKARDWIQANGDYDKLKASESRLLANTKLSESDKEELRFILHERLKVLLNANGGPEFDGDQCVLEVLALISKTKTRQELREMTSTYVEAHPQLMPNQRDQIAQAIARREDLLKKVDGAPRQEEVESPF